jgi:glycosyltransferase involved in cell wall biosynthesis
VALPHTTLTEKNLTCAYSAKVWKLVRMMQQEGCRVVLYGPDEVDLCEPDEHVVITTQRDREHWGFGEGFDTVQTPFLWDSGQPYWNKANRQAIRAMETRVEPRDFLLLIAGWAQEPIASAIAGKAYRNPITVEWGVGYEGIFSPFCAFESYAWMHHVYGLQSVPNFFDPTDFTPGLKKDDYLLFIGRLVTRKGPHVAAALADRMGMPLVVAGPGGTEWGQGYVRYIEGETEGNLEYVGEVGLEERAELMARAYAVIVPTLYIEPFGGVAVEAMLSGTPVIASDWGSFTEIVENGVTGQRFRTLKQGAAALEAVGKLDPTKIAQRARERFSLAAVGPMFTAYFDQLDTLWGAGWYA